MKMAAFQNSTTIEAVENYDACLGSFLTGFMAENPDNIRCVVLYGGLVRDSQPIPGWSDIDLIAVFEDIRERDPLKLALLLERTEAAFRIRIDLTQFDMRWLLDPSLLASSFSSEVLNCLAMRPNVSRLLCGALPHLAISPDQERLAARFYIDHTLGLFRRYLVEHVYRGSFEDDRIHSVARVTRWLFSIIRASLRLFDLFVHPYSPSLEELGILFPHLDLTVPYSLLQLRMKPAVIRADHALFISVETFLEGYVPFILKEADKWMAARQRT
jgi:hypothetical protein